MTKQNEAGSEEKPTKKTYTMQDLMKATKDILKSDNIGSKLPDTAIEKLSKLLAKTAIKGDL
jgi:hypothetical protein